jgi:hypothetical protein
LHGLCLAADRLSTSLPDGEIGVRDSKDATGPVAEPLPQVADRLRRRGRLSVTRPGRSAGRGERRVLGENAGLEFLQGRAWVDAHLADQTLTDFGIGAQSLRLPAGPVEGEDEQLPQALAERVLPAQCLQLGGELTMAAQSQVGSGP